MGLLLVAREARATPSGLDNIATADTNPHGVLTFQQYDTFGSGRRPDYSAGARFGLQPRGVGLEIGIDSHLGPPAAGPPIFNAKAALQPAPRWPRFAVGVANAGLTADDRARAGQPFSYGVATWDLGVFRLTGGYGLQTMNDAGFLGIDRTLRLFGGNLMLRSDAIQVEDQSAWLTSVGFMYTLDPTWALEAWINIPTGQGDPSFTVKLDISLDVL